MIMSCEKKVEQAGLEIQPDENRLHIVNYNLSAFSTYTSPSNSVSSSKNNSLILLGSINDAIFGRTSAFFVSQYRLSSDHVNFGTNAQIISATAFMDIDGIEGDSAQNIHFLVYESNFEIKSDSAYDSKTDLGNIGDLVADYTVTPDSFNIMALPLLNAFGQKILSTDSTNLVDNDAFASVFKGLYFTVDSNDVGPGSIYKYNFNSASSYIELQYTNDDDTLNHSFKLQFNESCGRFNLFFNNYAPLTSEFGLTSSKIYLSGTAGTRGHINLSPVLSFRDSSKMMIYKAELLIKAMEVSPFTAPTRILLEVDDNDDEVLKLVDDYVIGVASNYGGYYNSDSLTYSMVITRHVQNLINGNQNDSLLWINPYAQITNPNRIILLNGENNQDDITLRITYSKIN